MSIRYLQNQTSIQTVIINLVLQISNVHFYSRHLKWPYLIACWPKLTAVGLLDVTSTKTLVLFLDAIYFSSFFAQLQLAHEATYSRLIVNQPH